MPASHQMSDRLGFHTGDHGCEGSSPSNSQAAHYCTDIEQNPLVCQNRILSKAVVSEMMS